MTKQSTFRIGIFGGTFDPPHYGHIAIAKQAAKQLMLNKIYFIPAYIPPHKQFHIPTTANNRLAMVKMAIEGQKNFTVSAIELRRRGISYTIDTVRYFRKRYPSAELILIIGADNLAQFHTWKQPATILQLASLAVYKRKGYSTVWNDKEIPFQRIKGMSYNVSSTEVRTRMKKGLPVSKYIAKPVWNYIKHHSLYLEYSRKNKNCHEINCTHQ